MVKNLPANERLLMLDPWVRKIPGSRKDKPLQYSCLESSMDRGAWQATVRVSQSQTQLSRHAHLFMYLPLHLNCKSYKRRKCVWFTFGSPVPTKQEAFIKYLLNLRASSIAQQVKNLPTMQKTQEIWVPSLGQEDPLDPLATHCSILAWKNAMEPGGLHS